MMIYPWNNAAWNALKQLRRGLPHAVLVQGREGMGAFDLAMEFSRALLCESPGPEEQACGRCSACNWFVQGNHPDFRLVRPESMTPETDADPAPKKEKRSEQIRIEQVRGLQDFLAIGTHRAGARVILIHPAEAINPNAQNALLKNLEEPPPGTVFVLVAARLERLLPTIRSRCVQVTLATPDPGLSLAWMKEQRVENAAALLAAAGGAPLAALELASSESDREGVLAALGNRRFSPIALAEQLQRFPVADAVTWLQRWSYDLLAFRLGCQIRYNQQYKYFIEDISSSCRASEWSGYLRLLAQARGLAQHPLNAKLFFEDLLFRYRALIADGS